VAGLAELLVELRALTEAMLDFPEEEVDSLHRDDAALRLARVRSALDGLLAKSRSGSLLRSGIHVVLAGRPNVGKSSLLNRLAGEERAIVTPIAGTTRDALREPIQIDGVPLVVVDTAGLRASADVIERMGIERAQLELERADLVLAVHEAGKAPAVLEGLPADVSRIDVYNKVDLAPGFHPPAGAHRSLAVSAKNGDGSYGESVFYGTGSLPSSVVIGDVDGDDRLDVLTVNYSSSSLSVMLGNGDGTFAAQREHGLGKTVGDVTLGDQVLVMVDTAKRQPILPVDGRPEVRRALGMSSA